MKQKKLNTLCILHNQTHILLGQKKRGFRPGLWNGYGGKVMEGESVDSAAVRELREESGIILESLPKRGIMTFLMDGHEEVWEMHIYAVGEFNGEAIETDEMRPQWFKRAELPSEKMWPDNLIWLPLIFAGKNFRGTMHYDREYNVISHEIVEVSEL